MRSSFKIVMLFAFMAIGNLCLAQTTRFSNRNNDERIANVVTTTDATVTTIDSVVLNTNEGGLVQVTVIGYAKDTAYAVTGVLQARFNKRRGTLTLGTSTESLAITADTPLSGATFALSVINNQIYVRVTGKVSTSIRWYAITRKKSISTVL